MLAAAIRDIFFVDNAELASHSEEQLQSLIDRFSRACEDFSLTISLKKTNNVMGQEVEQLSMITVNN